MGPGRKPRRPVFSQRGSYGFTVFDSLKKIVFLYCFIVGLHCCEKAENATCMAGCIAAFENYDNDHDIINDVEKSCGPSDLLVSQL